MTAREIKDKAILVLILNLILPGLGSILACNEIAEALRRTGKDPKADPDAIRRNGITQLVLAVVGSILIPMVCCIPAIIVVPIAAWIWAFIFDTLMKFYGAMISVKDEDTGPISDK